MNYKKKWTDALLKHLRTVETDEVSTRDSRIIGYITELEEAGKIEIVSQQSGVIVLRLKRVQPNAP